VHKNIFNCWLSDSVKAVLPDSVSDMCSASVAAMSDPTLVTNLYFCGSCPDPQRILQTGFTDQGHWVHSKWCILFSF